MDVKAAILDQRLNNTLNQISARIEEEIGIPEKNERQRTLTFIYLCLQIMLELDDDQSFDALTDGGQDFGVDAMHVGDELDGEFLVTIFQGKYKQDLGGNSNFPERGVKSALDAVRFLFNPYAQVNVNKRLLPKIEEVRSRIQDGYMPHVRVLLCNNGLKWNHAAEDSIKNFGNSEQVTWEHVNHEKLLNIIQSTKAVNDTLSLQGQAIVEDFEFNRVLIGKATVEEIAALISRHGDQLLERNIRRYLGLTGNRVNEAIRDTLMDADDRPNFYFYNNGITFTCTKFEHNGLQSLNHQVNIENLQIINGGQTSNTIARVLKHVTRNRRNLEKAFVLIRLYQLSSTQKDFVHNITFATNSQNPVDLKDLKSNDEVQRRLETDVAQLGYNYRRKKSDTSSTRPEDISPATAAEAILAVWRKRPHQAKFFAREHFGKLYSEIFNQSLTGAELVTATLLYRIAENKRKRPSANAPEFLPYASCFLAMRMGEYLCCALGLDDNETLSHTEFKKTVSYITSYGEEYFEASCLDIAEALKALYKDDKPTLQRLSATFRRGDLIEELKKLPLRKIDEL